MEIYTVKEAAEILKMSEVGVRKALADGRLNSYQPGGPGGRHKIAEKHIREFLEGKNKD